MIIQGRGGLPQALGGQAWAIGANQEYPPARTQVTPRGSGQPRPQVAIPLITCLQAADRPAIRPV